MRNAMKLTTPTDREKEVRDGAVASGMEQGMAAGFDRLEDVLASPAT